MSRMGAIHLELYELGHEKVREIEDHVVHMRDIEQIPIRYIVSFIIEKYNTDLNTTLMIIEGAENQSCSKAVYPREVH